MGDGSCVLLPGGVEQYLHSRRDRPTESSRVTASVEPRSTTNAARRQAKKDLARLEQQIARVDERLAALHDQMAGAASNYERLTELQRELDQLGTVKVGLESAWLEAAELAG